MNENDRLLTESEAAKYLCCSKRTLLGHVKDGAIIPIPIGRGSKRQYRRYELTDLRAFKLRLKAKAKSRAEKHLASNRPTLKRAIPAAIFDFLQMQKPRK